MILLVPANKITHTVVRDQSADHLSNTPFSGSYLSHFPR